MGAKKFALRHCVIAKARKSSPCALKTPHIWRFCACWESFFAERPLEGLCWESFFAERPLEGLCWASIFAPTGTVSVLEAARRPPDRLRWGFCAMRSPLAACHRRVGALDGVIPPPVGGGATATSGGVAAKVQTHWTKVAENGLFWLNGSALWRICCLSWCVGRTRTRY